MLKELFGKALSKNKKQEARRKNKLNVGPTLARGPQQPSDFWVYIKNWGGEWMWEAVARGPHQLSRSPEALTHFATESAEKVRVGQAKLVLWDNIKDNPPPQLKI